MRILRLVHEYPLPWHGMTPGPYELSAAQVALGDAVTIVCGGYPHFRTLRDERFRVLRTKATLPYIGPFPATMSISALRAWWELRRRLVGVIHAHNHMGFYLHLARRWRGRQGGPPLALHLDITAAGREARALAAGQRLDPVTRYYEWPLHKLADRVGCQVAEAIICVSESTRADAIRYGGADPAKTYVVSNGVNPDRFRPEGPNCRAELGLSPRDQVVLYVGGLHHRKNVLALVRALRHLPPEVKLLAVGAGPQEYVQAINQTAATDGVRERVILAGYVPYPDLPPYYRTGDLFVLPSSYEGFPKVLLEALASGVPSLASPSFAGDGEIEKHYAPLADRGPEALAEAIARLLTQRPVVDVAAIRQRYDWAVAARRCREIYERIGAR